MKKIVLFILSLAFYLSNIAQEQKLTYSHGAIVKGDSSKKELALVFTGDEFGEGLCTIIKTLRTEKIKASFFFTGRFYGNKKFATNIHQLKKDGHYLGPHSNNHLLYCDWNKRDSLLVTKDSFTIDISENFEAMTKNGLTIFIPHYFIPPFEWWNDSIANWSSQNGLKLFNFTPGIRTNADYTWPELSSYKSSEWIMNWMKEFTNNDSTALNGAIILIHAGTDPRRKDKLYNRLGEMVKLLKAQGYVFKRIDKLLNLTP